ncbi:protein RTA1 [Aspergillus udagawae]|uniref:Protein RTA1 n=1 Tax=Aspergillus udagawae TaxID=91492 RepID=A0A8H3RIQ6_9EURO|nr:protein RTA1 [Aspergillus udagawae]
MDFTFHNGTNGSSPWVEFYPYTPSNTAGYAFMAIFGIATVVHIILMFPYRAAYFIPLVLGGICESFGYYGRAWSHQDRTEIGSWALQEMLILCAPPFVAATIYMVLGRIIRAFNAEHHSSIRTKWLTTIFVLNDVICFLTQIAGAGVQVTGDEHIMAIGKKAVLAGLIFALVVFGLFVWVAAVFHRRLDAEPTAVVMECPRLGWKKYMWAIYISCGMLMVRNLVRTIQFGSEKGSALNTEEVYIYVFDAALMACSIGLLIVWHPGRLVRKAQKANKASQLCGQMEDAADIPLTGYREV